METKSLRTGFPRADFYVIFPFFINDWSGFECGLAESGIWRAKTDCSRQSLKNTIHAYLGEDEARDFPIQTGLAFIGDIQKSKDPSLSSFTGEVAFMNAKGELLPSKDKVRTLWPDFMIETHVAPSRHAGLAMLHFKTKTCSLHEAVDINYTIQKCDPKLIPFLCSFRNGEWSPVKGRETLKALFEGLLPGCITPVNDARFLMASNVGVDTSAKPKVADIENALVKLGMVKDWKYKTNEDERNGIKKLFENIWTHASHEGFAAVYLTPDMQAEIFLKDFHGRFPKSYLPIYLVSILAELTFQWAMRNPDYVANKLEELDRARETNLVLNFEPSHYTHHIQLMDSFRNTLHLDKKFEIILSNIEARRAQIDAQRLQLEKENQALALQRKAEAEEAGKRMEEEKKIEQQNREARDRNINFLLGFIGIGQVVFAILQLLGAESIFGSRAAESETLRIAAIVSTALFSAMIIYLIVMAFIKKR